MIIADPGSNNHDKTGGRKNLLSYLFFVPPNSQKIKLFYFLAGKEKSEPIDKDLAIFARKIISKLSEIRLRIRDPRSGRIQGW
jgi:hypothetical protein